MHVIWISIIGLVVGALAKRLIPGKDPGGVVTTLLGAAGAVRDRNRTARAVRR